MLIFIVFLSGLLLGFTIGFLTGAADHLRVNTIPSAPKRRVEWWQIPELADRDRQEKGQWI